MTVVILADDDPEQLRPDEEVGSPEPRQFRRTSIHQEAGYFEEIKGTKLRIWVRTPISQVLFIRRHMNW
jgi:hypothetical protein